MLDDDGFEIYEENPFPMAYLLTFRTYGSWLHGHERYSVGRSKNNRYGGSKIQPSVPLMEFMDEKSRHPAVTLDNLQRKLVGDAIAEVCEYRNYFLRASNIRTNHTHAVVSAAIKPEKIVNDFKVYSTRKLREEWQFSTEQKIWSRGSSTRYLWKPKACFSCR